MVSMGLKSKCLKRWSFFLRVMTSRVFSETFSLRVADISAFGLNLRAEHSAKLWLGRPHLGMGFVLSPVQESFVVTGGQTLISQWKLSSLSRAGQLGAAQTPREMCGLFWEAERLRM